MSESARRLTLLDCLGIGINGIVGSGIYLLIAPLALRAGAASVLGILACAGLCILIALCFAELAGMYERSGGPYVYARAAFGPRVGSIVGFGVGWMSMATGVLAFAAVAVGFAEALARVWTPLATLGFALGPWILQGKSAVALVLIGSLGAINYYGVKGGARTSTALSVLKLLPLLLLAIVGVAFLKADVFTSIFSSTGLPPAADGTAQGFGGAIASSAFLAVFMLSGFEFVVVPAGEARNARRNVPIAIIGSLVFAAGLYALLQLVALSVLPDLATRTQPLLDVAGAIFGPVGVLVLSFAALVSMAGFCASSALVGPRYFSALAEDGYLPERLSGLSRFATPGPAILLATSLAAVLSLVLGYAALVDISNVALFGQYVPTALAVIVLRFTQPAAPRAFRLPFGILIPVLATAGSLLLLWAASPPRAEWIFSAQLLAAGFVLWGTLALYRRWKMGRKATAAGLPG